MASWRDIASRLRDLSLFGTKTERDYFALAVAAAAFLLPFTLSNFVQGRPLIGAVTTSLVVWFMVNGIALYRGRRLVPATIVFLPALAVLGFALVARGDVALFLAYPALLLFHFILSLR